MKLPLRRDDNYSLAVLFLLLRERLNQFSSVLRGGIFQHHKGK